jgi:hypothetical protein
VLAAVHDHGAVLVGVRVHRVEEVLLVTHAERGWNAVLPHV